MPGQASVVGDVSTLGLRDATRTTALEAIVGLENTRVRGDEVVPGGAEGCI